MNCIIRNYIKSFNKLYATINHMDTIIQISQYFSHTKSCNLDLRSVISNFKNFYFLYELKGHFL